MKSNMDNDELKLLFSGLSKKIDKVDSRLDAANIVLAKQSVILADHVKRSTQLENRMLPVEQHVQAVNTILKMFGFTSLLVSMVAGILKIFKIL